MKKQYVAPALTASLVTPVQMMAVSLKPDPADPNTPVLVEEENETVATPSVWDQEW